MKKLALALLMVTALTSVTVSSAGAVEVGDTAAFYYKDHTLFPPQTAPDQIPLVATCRLVSDNAYWFVANNLEYSLPGGYSADDLMAWYSAFEVETPSDESGGIFQQVISRYGRAAVNDDDPKLYILIHDFGVLPHRCQVYSYYREKDFVADDNTRNPHDVLYLHAADMNGQDICGNTTSITRDVALPEAVTSLVHLTVHGNDPAEVPWVKEGLALRSLYLSGYWPEVLNDLRDFTDRPNARFIELDRGTTYEYTTGALLLFFTYLEEQLGAATLQSVVTSTQTGFDGITEAIEQNGGAITGMDFYQRWIVANWLNSGRDYGYSGISFPDLLPTRFINHLNTDEIVPVSEYTTEYVKIETDSLSIDDRLRLTMTNDSIDELLVQVIQIQEPKENSLILPFERLVTSEGKAYLQLDLIGLGNSSPYVLVQVTRMQEGVMPLTPHLVTEINPVLPVDGDEDLAEAEAEPEPEPEPDMDEEAEPEFEEYIIEHRDRIGSTSSSGCAAGGLGLLPLLLMMLAWRRNRCRNNA